MKHKAAKVLAFPFLVLAMLCEAISWACADVIVALERIGQCQMTQQEEENNHDR